MSSTVFFDIRAALTTHLEDLAGLPEIAWENRPYTPIQGVPYLAPTLLMAESEAAGIGEAAGNWQRGLYQLSIVYPHGEGVEAINTLMGLLSTHFKRGTELMFNDLKVTIRKNYVGPQTSSAADGLRQVMSIAFYAYATN